MLLTKQAGLAAALFLVACMLVLPAEKAWAQAADDVDQQDQSDFIDDHTQTTDMAQSEWDCMIDEVEPPAGYAQPPKVYNNAKQRQGEVTRESNPLDQAKQYADQLEQDMQTKVSQSGAGKYGNDQSDGAPCQVGSASAGLMLPGPLYADDEPVRENVPEERTCKIAANENSEPTKILASPIVAMYATPIAASSNGPCKRSRKQYCKNDAYKDQSKDGKGQVKKTKEDKGTCKGDPYKCSGGGGGGGAGGG